MALQITHTIGRRKTSTARVHVRLGNGNITINNRDLEKYFPLKSHQNVVTLPLELTETLAKYDIKVTVAGGGISGQAGAVQLGIARALQKLEEGAHAALKPHSLFTRDSRMVERKKPGRPKARKRFQFSKR